MMSWTAILNVWIYPLTIVAVLLDAASTWTLLRYDDTAEEANSRVAWVHDRFGLSRGTILFYTGAAGLALAGVYVVKNSSGLAITSLFVGMYLGFGLRQGATAYHVWQTV